MPKVSGYVRFIKGPPVDSIPNYSIVGFLVSPAYAARVNVAWIQMNPNEAVELISYVDSKLIEGPLVTGFKRKTVYPFTAEYTPGGTFKATLAGTFLGELPAPKTEQPFNVFNAWYYPNWWDVPEHRGATISTVLPMAVGVGLLKFIK